MDKSYEDVYYNFDENRHKNLWELKNRLKQEYGVADDWSSNARRLQRIMKSRRDDEFKVVGIEKMLFEIYRGSQKFRKDNEIPFNEMPDWMTHINEELKHSYRLCHITDRMAHINIRDILKDSCFYYAAGNDISPIITFEGYVYSFVHCDILDYDDYFSNMELIKAKLRIHDYEEIQKMNIGEDFLQINPRNDWTYNKSELSLWKKNGKIMSLLYIVDRSEVVWENLYEKFNIRPLAICNLVNEGPSPEIKSENLLPIYILGYIYGSQEYEKLLDKKFVYLGTEYSADHDYLEYMGAGYLSKIKSI